ncbi:hypothetical protein VTK26DRAFT_8292 [Humicola hyalothermophila]
MQPCWIAMTILFSAASAHKRERYRPSTSVATATPTPTSISTSELVTSYPDSCTYRPTQTYYSSSGCALSCSTRFCIIDAPATISCGCPTVFIETQTVTVCPTATPCWQCTTGWGTFIYTETCTSTAAPLPTDG